MEKSGSSNKDSFLPRNMAANFWASSQRQHWLMGREKLAETVQKLEDENRALVQQYPLPDRRSLSIFFNQQIIKLGKMLKVRQQAIATAQVYVRRYYTRVEMRRTNPFLVLATAIYLACKMEESPHHIRTLVMEIKAAGSEYGFIDTSKMGECEFKLISVLNSQLIVHHPYRTLSKIQSSLGLTQDELQTAWNFINDSYMTDLMFFYAPHDIALAAVFLATGLKSPAAAIQGGNQQAQMMQPGSAAPVAASAGTGAGAGAPGNSAGIGTRSERIQTWFASTEVDMEGVIDCTQELMTLYEGWDSYQEKQCKEQISRYLKARALEK